ncbi:acetyltransferase [Salinisphaera dokdonensis CL-ES53]|uniref:Acetyltransferase n=1 Tax=Salinisphaera dokdonensis CL-ES53 TaxID=1304272 RepID=A0ABV2AZX8_9GAMM
MTAIRRFRGDDWAELWALIEPVFRAGETYSYPTDISEEQARAVWIEQPVATFVAVDAGTGELLGTYFLKPNQPGLGNHVCNCGYIVATKARGRGVASALCEHSQSEAIAHGFRAMQYNLVVETNTGAVRLWQRLGFEIVGQLPGAFRHPVEGEVDAFVMYKRLTG